MRMRTAGAAASGPRVKPLVRPVLGLAPKAGAGAAGTAGAQLLLLGRRCRFHLWEPRGFAYNKPLPLEEARKEYAAGPWARDTPAQDLFALRRAVPAEPAAESGGGIHSPRRSPVRVA